jgi:hypothetical protein
VRVDGLGPGQSLPSIAPLALPALQLVGVASHLDQRDVVPDEDVEQVVEPHRSLGG